MCLLHFFPPTFLKKGDFYVAVLFLALNWKRPKNQCWPSLKILECFGKSKARSLIIRLNHSLHILLGGVMKTTVVWFTGLITSFIWTLLDPWNFFEVARKNLDKVVDCNNRSLIYRPKKVQDKVWDNKIWHWYFVYPRIDDWY